MPAVRIIKREHGTALAAIGSYSTDNGAVDHVGLLVQSRDLEPAGQVQVFDVGPPIRVGQRDERGVPITQLMKADVVGWADLDDEQRRGIEAVIQDIQTRLPSKPLNAFERMAQYVAVPAFRRVVAELPGREGGFRFSCAGLVFYCYQRGAALDLVDIANIPPISFEMLKSIWPHVGALRPAHRIAIGLEGPGPWPVLLPGYLFHSLARPSLDEPYVPSPEDRAFPHAPPEHGETPS